MSNQLGRGRHTSLIAAHAWSDVDLTAVFAPDSDDDPGWAEMATVEESVLAERLARWRETYRDVDVNKVVVRDRPVHQLVELSRHARVVVIGSRGRGGFTALLLGSTSGALLHASHCPLMIVRG
ncbi:universal stress protein [Rhodococcus erythropolis]|uniref:universal stress protein n=1 Tax=Rhodococcus erythropolis TaxID=1833 RepID=UPI001E43053B|nr:MULTISPECIES: universal stress protein [Rhodococcus erythropolis group]MCD2104551.1 universal stress protein [Rhodococcus qingshengii]MCZ4525325.1 universal stress protein [Rhodococcus erythropolis]